MSYSIRMPALNDLPPVTRAMVIASFCGWVLEMAFGGPLNAYLGLVPLKVIGSGWLWQPFSYMFIHAGFWHFFFNAFMLWFLGAALEPALGSRKYLLFFIFCGAASGLFTALVSPHSAVPVVGASGAIYGLLFAFAALYPDQVVYMYFFFPMSARQFVIFLAGMALVLSFTAPHSGVSNFTHLSGLIAGWLWFRAPGWLERFRGRGVRDEEGEAAAARQRERSEEEEEVDAILSKISRQGQESLTARERDILDEYARRKGGRA